MRASSVQWQKPLLPKGAESCEALELVSCQEQSRPWLMLRLTRDVTTTTWAGLAATAAPGASNARAPGEAKQASVAKAASRAATGHTVKSRLIKS